MLTGRDRAGLEERIPAAENDGWRRTTWCEADSPKHRHERRTRLQRRMRSRSPEASDGDAPEHPSASAFYAGRLPRLEDVREPPAASAHYSSAKISWWSLLLVSTVVLVASSAVALSPSTDYTNSKNSSEVCLSMDIRNSPQMLHKLKGCRVVEGFLHITLFDPTESRSQPFENLSFPELREITGYLLMYRVYSLKTLGDLFPNLSVIRGHKLFSNYALVLYEVMHLTEIGLHSLTDITRGSVRIEKNYMLCYVNSIDWDLIAYNGKGENFIANNKADNECPLCPGDDGGSAPLGMSCPVASGAGKGGAKRHLCWNQKHCQKVCRGDCPGRACTITGECCDPSCLGGCQVGKPSNCTVCKDLSIRNFANKQCVSKCPPGTYEHQGRRCIDANECQLQLRPKELDDKTTISHPYKPINGSCMLKCPPNYLEIVEGNRTRCEPCQGTCKRECLGLSVSSIQMAQHLRGCTHIKGSLEINVRGGGNIIKELEEGLGLITEIHGSLKISRSYPLISLNFLKSLRKINGLDGTKKLANALIVTDNQNLQDLWDWEKHGPIDIANGKLFFHFNPKLCYDKIRPLQKMAKDSEFSELEVALNSNGDKIACNVTLLNVTVVNKTKDSVLISWDPFLYEDTRSLLGYVVYNTKAPIQNVTLYEGRDACGGDGWQVDDVQDFTTVGTVFQLITHLKPYTQYAFYVKTYTIATERRGAQSDIIYVRTLPGVPSEPRPIEILSPDPNTLTLKWLPPVLPNGNVTEYRILVKYEPDTENFLKQRNYCIEPPVHSTEDKKPVIEVEKSITDAEESTDDSKCSCDANLSGKAEEAIQQINFEDYIQNQVYQKRTFTSEISRKRRDLDRLNYMDTPIEFPNQPSKDQPEVDQDFITIKDGDYYKQFAEVVKGRTSLNISSLRHYSAHSIAFQACREVEPEELKNQSSVPKNCSTKLFIVHRTAKKMGADEITGLDVKIQTNNSLGAVRVEWNEPERPNSIVLTYHIQYKREDIENYAFTTECITRQEFFAKKDSSSKPGYIIKNLNAGNYSIRVMATSLAGNGNYSQFKFFYIEETTFSTKLKVLIGIVVLLLVIGPFGLFMLYRKLYPPPLNLPKTLIADVNPEYISAVYVPDEWEVPRSSIEFIKELGQGSFGMVYQGIVRDLPTSTKSTIYISTNSKSDDVMCAIKTVNEHATERERSDFLKEASVMKAFDTPHVVRLLGVVSSGLPTLVIMELMLFGDLKSYLRQNRTDSNKPTLNRIMQMAMEIADGMAYLSANKFVHRDLAARNCMVSNDLKVKVGDFGMTRDIYETDYYRKGSKGLLPVRWMSPESLKDGVFTSSSDVWSYGVVLWEMATLASQPYQGLSNDQVLRYVIDGGVMERPENCPDKLYQLMQRTWQHRPTLRPTFLQLVAFLATEASPEFKTSSFFFSEQGQELLHQAQPATGIVEETSRSLSPPHLDASSAKAYLESDSSPTGTPRVPQSHSPPMQIFGRDFIKGVRQFSDKTSYSDKTRGEPHELEALVGEYPENLPLESEPLKASLSPSASTAPNGFLSRPSNNGNPTLLGSSHC